MACTGNAPCAKEAEEATQSSKLTRLQKLLILAVRASAIDLRSWLLSRVLTFSTLDECVNVYLQLEVFTDYTAREIFRESIIYIWLGVCCCT